MTKYLYQMYLKCMYVCMYVYISVFYVCTACIVDLGIYYNNKYIHSCECMYVVSKYMQYVCM